MNPIHKETLFTLIAICFLLLMLVLFIVIIVGLFKKRQTEYRQEKVDLLAQYQQESLQAQLEIQHQTLEQIGRDLHDNLGQLLSVAMLQLHMLEGDVAHLPQIRELREVISKTIYELRSLSKSLDGGLVQDFGLVESLSHELLRMRNTQKYQTEITIEGQVYRLEGKKEIVLFRVAQEILNNIMKHAAAKRVQISLHYASHCFMLVVEDDGKGFDYETFLKGNTSTSGAGLRNIRRRIEILGGTYTISTAEGQGTKIVIKLPISSKIP